jgi:MarR family transcriptional regulator, transcriptional regulator for hemolysin
LTFCDKRTILVAFATNIVRLINGSDIVHRALSIILRGSDIFMSRCLADIGMTASEAVILMYLSEHENVLQKDISNYFMLDKGTVAKTVQRLVAKAMIECVVNSNDQREKVIRVTAKGSCVKNVCGQLIKQWHEALFHGISEDELADFQRITGKMSANVTENLDKWETLNEKK